MVIDLYHGRVLTHAARGFRLLVPDVIVVEELRTPRGPELVHQGLIEAVTFTGEELLAILNLRGKYPGPSLADLFALHLAHTQGLVLLTGDGLLRKVARREGVEARGVLWVLEQLIAMGLLLPHEAAVSLEHMLKAGARLPERAWRPRLHAWQRGEAL